jgi:hypothetical protein
MRIFFHASLVVCPRVVAPGASAFVSSSIVASSIIAKDSDKHSQK